VTSWTPATRRDRVIARIVGFLARAFYRRIDVHWTEPARSGPVLSVANHFGGLADAIVVLDTLPRHPRIIARDVIWKIPLVGILMNWVGALPVHKSEDRGAMSANDQMFSSCYEGLRQGDLLHIFPEGVTRNEPSIARVKTGAARIVLGARASGVGGITIQPLGIHYEDKAALRSRIVVQGGRTIDVDGFAAPLEVDGRVVTADDRDAVAALTALIDAELRRAAPDYEDWGEARDLTEAAEITVRAELESDDLVVPIALRDRLANVLAELPAPHRVEIRSAVADYRADLDGVGLTDAEFTRQLTAGRFALRLTGQILLGVLLLPFAVVGAGINLIPFLIVKAVGLLRVAPSVMSTIKPIVAMVAFGITWGIQLWRIGEEWGVGGVAAGVVLLPVYAAAVVFVFDRAVMMWRLFRRWRATHKSRGITDELAAHRAAVFEATVAA